MVGPSTFRSSSSLVAITPDPLVVALGWLLDGGLTTRLARRRDGPE
jgi:hypothetical protein